MDKASVAAALSFSGRTRRQLALSWSGDWRTVQARVLTPFWAGSDVRWQLRGNARDLAGNTLAPAGGSYRLVRQGTVALPLVVGLVGTVDSADNVQTDGEELVVGRVGSQAVRAFLSFDLAALPPEVTRITAARLRVLHVSCQGEPYAGMGLLLAQSVLYGALDADAFHVAIESSAHCAGAACVGLQQTTPLSRECMPGWRELDATSNVQTDWLAKDASGRRVQYRLAFALDTTMRFSGNARLAGGKSETPPQLLVTYEYP